MVNDTAAGVFTDTGEMRTFPRPGVGVAYDNLTVSHRPLADESARTAPVKARNEQSLPAPGPQLPFVHVARAVAAREIAALKARAEGIERDLARGVIGVVGQPVPHLIEKQKQDREALESIRAEIGRLENLSDLEVRQYAADKGYK